MVYESDFYTTRRPYRASPSYSTYTVSSAPSRQIRMLPGLGKVHIVHTYDRIVPYVGHKRLTVVTMPPKVYSTSNSVLHREYDWIENKVRPWVAYSPTNRYLNSDSAVRYVYVRNPITGYRYHTDYIPSRYYNFYRIIRPSGLSEDYWPYKPLSSYYPDWPLAKALNYSYLDDIPVYRSLKFARTGLDSYAYNRRWYSDYYDYYRYYRPLSLYYTRYWPSLSRPLNYPSSYYLPSSYWYYWPRTWTYDNYWPKSLDYSYSWSYPYLRSHYWLKYHPVSYTEGLSSNYGKYLKAIFDDETRLIRAQSASLLKRIHTPVPRVRGWPITPLNRYGETYSLPARYSNNTYIHRLLTVSPKNSKVEYATYYTEPVRKYIGHGHLSCVKYAGDKGYHRRHQLAVYDDPVKNDIQLLSYYINKFRQEKTQPKEIKVPLSPARPSRIFTVQKHLEDSTTQEIKDLREARAARLAKIYDDDAPSKTSTDVADAVKAKKKKEEARLAEERALLEEQTKKAAQAKKDEAARKAELARQEELAAQAAAERAADIERQAELVRQEEIAKQAEIEKARKAEEEKARLDEERRLEDEAKAEEERKQLARLEEIARQAEEEKEAELARQADELAELARQEAELAELERQEKELADQAAREAEAAELARQEAELAELERQEQELAELAKQEAELADQATEDAEAAKREAEAAELARQEAELAELAKQEAELAELERQQAELDALEAEARALEEDVPAAAAEPAEEEEEAPAAEEAAAEEEVEEEEEEDEE